MTPLGFAEPEVAQEPTQGDDLAQFLIQQGGKVRDPNAPPPLEEQDTATVLTQMGGVVRKPGAPAPKAKPEEDLATFLQKMGGKVRPPAPRTAQEMYEANQKAAETPPPQVGPDFGYGKRYNMGNAATAQQKGLGFLGPLQRPDGGVMSEYSIGIEINGKEVEIPTIVPTLTKAEVQHLLSMKDGDKLPQSIVDKAAEFAQTRIAAGKDPFAQLGEQQTLFPDDLKRAQTPAIKGAVVEPVPAPPKIGPAKETAEQRLARRRAMTPRELLEAATIAKYGGNPEAPKDQNQWNPETGIRQAGRGVKQLYNDAPRFVQRALGIITGQVHDGQVLSDEDKNAVADVLEGTIETMKPSLLAPIALYPVGVSIAYAASATAGKATHALVKALGGSDADARLTSDIASVVAGGWGANKISRTIAEAGAQARGQRAAQAAADAADAAAYGPGPIRDVGQGRSGRLLEGPNGSQLALPEATGGEPPSEPTGRPVGGEPTPPGPPAPAGTALTGAQTRALPNMSIPMIREELTRTRATIDEILARQARVESMSPGASTTGRANLPQADQDAFSILPNRMAWLEALDAELTRRATPGAAPQADQTVVGALGPRKGPGATPSAAVSPAPAGPTQGPVQIDRRATRGDSPTGVERRMPIGTPAPPVRMADGNPIKTATKEELQYAVDHDADGSSLAAAAELAWREKGGEGAVATKPAAEMTDEELAASVMADVAAEQGGAPTTVAETAGTSQTGPANTETWVKEAPTTETAVQEPVKGLPTDEGGTGGAVVAPERTGAPAAPAATPPAAAVGSGKLPVVAYNANRHSVEVKFPAKPDRAVIDKLKAAGFRWAKSNGLWYAKLPAVPTGQHAETVARGLARAQALVEPNVPRAVESVGGEPALPVRKTAATWATDVPGLPRRLYEELAKVSSVDLGPTAEDELQKLRERLSTPGTTADAAVREVWGPELTKASPGLRTALTRGLALPETPSRTPQGSSGSVTSYKAGDKVEFQDYDGTWKPTEVVADTDADGQTKIKHPTLRMQAMWPPGAPSSPSLIHVEASKLRPIPVGGTGGTHGENGGEQGGNGGNAVSEGGIPESAPLTRAQAEATLTVALKARHANAKTTAGKAWGDVDEVQRKAALRKKVSAPAKAVATKKPPKEVPDDLSGGETGTQTLYFRSGSTRQADFDGFAATFVPIGVNAQELTEEVENRIAIYLEKGGQVFVDSGAFGGTVHFPTLLETYDRLVTEAGDGRVNLYLVAPDVLGDQAETQAVQKTYADALRILMNRGAHVIVPLQMGEMSLVDQMRQAQKTLTDGRPHQSLIFGIPFNKKAYTAEDVAEALTALKQPGTQIHLLGIGDRNNNFADAIATIRKADSTVQISSDSNRLRALFVKGRPAQNALDEKIEERAPERVDNDVDADTTELSGAFYSGNVNAFTPAELERLAESIDASVHDLKNAFKHDGRLQEMVDAAGGDDVVHLALYQIALARAKKTEGPLARTETITEVEQGTPEEQAARAEERAKRLKLMAELKAKLKDEPRFSTRDNRPAAVTPETVVLMVKIIRSYLHEKRSFADAVQAFQEEFGAGFARSLDRHFEIAWQKLTGAKVSVATALAEAQDTGKAHAQEPRGGVAPGQLPVSGGGAAEPGRAPGESALGAVPAKGGGDVQETGPAGAGHGHPSGVVAHPVPHRTGATPEPATEQPPSGSDVPESVAVPPAGDTHDPGVAPPDYVLTPERIRGIIDRGPVVRAEDNLRAIKLVKKLAEEQRYPTVEEQDSLAKYVGWGASDMAARLGEYEIATWSANERRIYRELKDLLTEKEREALRNSTSNAHFTYDLYKPIWNAIWRAGFTGGRVLEPSVGTGHAFGFMPPDVRHASILNGVELEPITAAIAHHLYPSAHIQAVGYENARIARGTQDLAIGNPPFGDWGVHDPRSPEVVTYRIHNYFFGHALEHVRPGGLIVFITSHYTMDASTPEAENLRKYLMQGAAFLGAVRLPNTAFDKSAKTEVVTDVIVLRKLRAGEKPGSNADLFIQSPLNQTLSTAPGSHDTKGRYQRMGTRVYRSAWYGAHPELVIGDETLEGSMHGGNEYTVTGHSADLTGDLDQALGEILPFGSYSAKTDDAPIDATKPPKPPKPPQVIEGIYKPGELRVGDKKGTIIRIDINGEVSDATPLKKDGTRDDAAVRRITAMIGIRDARNALVAEMKTTTATPESIRALQHKLQHVYDRFVQPKSAEPNYLNNPANKRAFKSDPEVDNLLGLETIETTAEQILRKGKKVLKLTHKVIGKADIFTKRTINAEVEITHVDTPKDALLTSLGAKGRLDWPYMANLLGDASKLRIQALQRTLSDEGLVFEQPDGSFVLAEEYLSGDVVSKLEDAESLHDPKFHANIAALKAVQPRPKTGDDIAAGTVSIGLGSHWVDPHDLRDFVAEQLNTSPRGVQYRLIGAQALVRWDGKASDQALIAARRHPLTVHYAPNAAGKTTEIYDFLNLVDDTLNLKQPDLGHYEGPSNDRRWVKEPEASLAARANQDLLRQAWFQFVYQHPDVQARLLEVFNTRFNRTAERKFDGSHMIYPGMAELRNKAGEVLHFFEHQNNGVWRILSSGNTLLAHEVGAGKTFEMIAAAMEMRRTGRATKPMIVVPTYLLSQWKQDIVRLYPTAKLLAFDEKDLDKSHRQQAMARIAHGNWDIVLVPHSSFALLKVSNERVIQVMQEWIDELLEAERQAGKDKTPSVKAMIRTRKKIEDKVHAKAEDINKGNDNALTWEQLGVDALFIDEAQSFKNLFFFSKIESLRGLSRSEADKSLDLFIKVKDINEQSNYRNLVLATATPVMNSIAEIFTMQRYLQPQTLRHHGVENFDNWYAMFALALAAVERQPDGTYKEVMRLKSYQNLQTLAHIVREVMDYVSWEDMPYLKLPKIKGGRIKIIQTEAHPMYPLLMEWFKDRMFQLKLTPPHIDRNGEYIAPERLDPLTHEPMGKPDNILTVMTDAKKAAVDVRLILGNRAKDWPGSRVQVAADHMLEIYKAEKEKKGVQLVFLDMGVPKNPDPLNFLQDVTIEDETDGEFDEPEDENTDAASANDDDQDSFNLYDALKAELVKRGVPAHEIAYIHQAKAPAERIVLFQAANDGKVRFVFASTDKGGVGMNIQERLAAVHEIDVPRHQRPGDLRQRMGRAIRQGNTYPEVALYRYVTKGTTDEWLWGLMSDKDLALRMFYRGEAANMMDEDPSTMSLEEAQIRASADPRGIELTELRGKMARLEAQAMAGERAVASARADLVSGQQAKGHYEKDLADLTAWLPNWSTKRGEAFSITIGDTTYAKRDEADTALMAALKPFIANAVTDSLKVGEIGGVPIYAKDTSFVNESYIKPDKTVAPRQVFKRVELHMDGSVYGGGTLDVGTVRQVNPDDPATLGEGQNILASIVNEYEAIPPRRFTMQARIEDADKKIAAAERVVANPPEAMKALIAAKTRVTQIETELKAEGVAQEAERKVSDDLAKAVAAVPVAERTAAQWAQLLERSHSGAHWDDIEKAGLTDEVKKLLNKPRFSTRRTTTASRIQTYASLPFTAMRGRSAPVAIIDAGFRLLEGERAAIVGHAGVQRVTTTLLAVLDEVREAMGVPATHIEHTGMLLSDKDYGVYLPKPDEDRGTIGLNPFEFMIGHATPEEAADIAYITAVHEVLHDMIVSDGPEFEAALADWLVTLGDRAPTWTTRIRRAYEQGGRPGNYDPALREVLGLYRESRRRPARRPDTLSAEGRGPAGQAVDTSAARQPARSVRRSRDGSSEEDIELDVDKRQLIRLLGPSMYNRPIIEVATKELLQNGFDAVRAKNVTMENPGHVDIIADAHTRTLTVTDDGIGMTPTVIKKAFFTIGGTSKEGSPENTSGGLGLAKMAFIIGSKRIKLVTTRDGVTSTVDVTSEEVQTGKITVRSERTGLPSGTSVSVVIPDNYTDSNGEVKGIYFDNDPDFLKKPLLGPVVVTLNGKTLPLGVNSTGYRLENEFQFSWGTIYLHVNPVREHYPRVNVLSAGLFQFDVYPWNSKQNEIPYHLILDVRPSVRTESDAYPFNNQREGFRSTIKADVDAMYIFLNRMGVEQMLLNAKESMQGVQAMPKLDMTEEWTEEEIRALERRTGGRTGELPAPPRAVKVRFTGGEVETTYDDNTHTTVPREVYVEKSFKPKRDVDFAAANMDPSVLDPTAPLFHNNTTEDFGNSPAERALFAEVGNTLLGFVRMWGQYTTEGDEGYDYQELADESVEGWFVGVSIDKTYRGLNSLAPIQAIWINPLAISSVGMTNPRAAAAEAIHLFVHEVTHVAARTEGAGFTAEFANNAALIRALDMPYDFYEQTLEKVFTKYWGTLVEANDRFTNYDTKNRAESFRSSSAVGPERTEGTDDAGRRVPAVHAPGDERLQPAGPGGTGGAPDTDRQAGSVGDILESLDRPRFSRRDEFEATVRPYVARLVLEASKNRSLVMSLLGPPSVSPLAKMGAGVWRAHIAAFDQKQQRARKVVRAWEKQMDGWTQEESLTFIDVMEHVQPITVLPADQQVIAATYREILDQWRDEVLRRDLLTSYLENYWPHEWVRGSNTIESILRKLFGRRPLAGPESYRRRRSIPTTREGIDDFHMEPASWNPTTQMLRKITEMGRSVMAHDIMEDLKAEGLRVFTRIGHKPPVPGWQIYPDPYGLVYGPRTVTVRTEDIDPETQEPVEVEGEPTFGRLVVGNYYGPSEVIRLLKNYLSPGLRGRSGLFDLYRWFGNTMNMVQMSMSLFHMHLTGLESVVSKQSLVFEQISRGQWKPALKTQTETAIRFAAGAAAGVSVGLMTGPMTGLAAASIVSAIPDLLRGHKLLKQFYAHDADATQRMLDTVTNQVVQGGGGFGWSLFEHSGAPDRFMAALRSSMGAAAAGQVGRATKQSLKALALTVPALIEVQSKPIMEWWVPRLKIAAYMDLARIELDRLGPGAELADARRALDGAWDQVDYRFGQLRYANLFWHTTLKDLLMGSVRAVGWNTGSLALLFGWPAAQLRRFQENRLAIGGAGGGGTPPPDVPMHLTGADAEGNPRYEPWLHHSTAWNMAMYLIYGLAGAILMYLLTGKGPKELKDYYFPRNGDKDANGRDERVRIIGYAGDAYAWTHHPITTAMHKVQPALTVISEVINDEDFYGVETRHRDDPWLQQIENAVQYVIGEYKPFSVTNTERNLPPGSTTSEKIKAWAAQATAATTPAPAEVERTAAENLARSWGTRQQTVRTEGQAEQQALTRAIRQAGGAGTAAAEAAIASGKLTPRQILQAERAAVRGQTYLQYAMQQQPIDRALTLYEVETPAERYQTKAMLMRKYFTGLQNVAPANREALADRYNRVILLPVQEVP